MPPLTQDDARKLIARRHPEWEECQRRWRFLQDSLEGGDRYRYADYSFDPTTPGPQPSPTISPFGDIDESTGIQRQIRYGRVTQRNLIPHLSEMSEDGWLGYTQRLARTPVPRHLARVVGRHLSRIYAHEVSRAGPGPVAEWWEDVDGRGTAIDDWMVDTLAPLLLTLGQIDVIMDQPPAPEGVPVESVADARRAGLDRVIASVVLPENMVWWRLDDAGRHYAECLVLERKPGDDGVCYRHWTAEESTLYDGRGKALETVPHPYGRPPVVRLFDRRSPRCTHVGVSRYDSIAELQKCIYNRRAEAEMRAVMQSSPLLSGPEDYLGSANGGEDRIPIGPGRALPKKRSTTGGSISYEGWEFVNPPTNTGDNDRADVQYYSDEVDRDAALTKPAGSTTGSTVAQSGISKSFDNQEGNDFLSALAGKLQQAEEALADLFTLVQSNGANAESGVKILYPREFDLHSPEELAKAIEDVQALAASAGALPETEYEMIRRFVRGMLPGLEDSTLNRIDKEIRQLVEDRKKEMDENREAGRMAMLTGVASGQEDATMNQRGTTTIQESPDGTET